MPPWQRCFAAAAAAAARAARRALPDWQGGCAPARQLWTRLLPLVAPLRGYHPR